MKLSSTEMKLITFTVLRYKVLCDLQLNNPQSCAHFSCQLTNHGGQEQQNELLHQDTLFNVEIYVAIWLVYRYPMTIVKLKIKIKLN